MINRVRIALVSPTSQKLNMVKIVKDFTGLGLKEAKDVVDTLHTYPSKIIEVDLSNALTKDGDVSTPKSFSKALDTLIDGKFLVNGGIQWERNKKILDLGIGTQEDYSDFIFDYIVERPHDAKNKFTKLDKEQLEKIYKILVEDYDSNS